MGCFKYSLAMRFNRKISPDTKIKQNFITKKRLREDEINFDDLRSYRLDRVKKELEKNNLEACILFDPVNVRYALDSVNMSVYNMHNLTRYCFVPVNGPTILYEYFNCEILSKHLNLIDEIRPAITWDYFSNGDQANIQLKKWINEIRELSKNYFKSKRIAIDVINGPAVSELNKAGIEVVDAKLIMEQARVIKSAEEIKCMKAALEVAEIGVAKMREELKPGMTRDDLLGINLKIIKQVAEGINKTSPNAFVICITNPLDVIVMALQKYSGLPKTKIVGMAGILDSSRFIYFLSQELKVPVKKIKSFVLGGHGDSMVAMLGSTEVEGKNILKLVEEGKISQKRLDEIINRTKTGGAEIVKYLEKGSAFYAPAASGVEMAESYLKDLKKQLPCAAYLNGEYGFKDIYAGVPVIIGKNGVEKIIEIELSKNEKNDFDKSIEAVKDLFDAAKKIDSSL